MDQVRPILARSPTMISSYNAVYLLHLSAFILYMYTFFWLFSPEVSKLSLGNGFGWFTKYFTCCSFFLHLSTLLVCNLSHQVPEAKSLQTLADDLSCAVFSITHVCNIAYWLKFTLTLPPTSLSALDVPPSWLILNMHILNSVIAALDLLLAKRSFSKRSWRMTRAFSVAYIVWINICAFVNKRYPYDFLNALPQPHSFFLIAAVVYVSIGLFFRLGSVLAQPAGEEEKPKQL